MKKKILLEDISKDCNIKVYESKAENDYYDFKVGDIVTFVLDGEEYTNRVIEVGPNGVKMEPILDEGV